MGEASYLAAALPKTHTILGQRLEPFSIGHAMLLTRLENGFIVLPVEQDPGIEDLILGVFICAHPYAEALAALNDPELEKKLEEWGKQIGVFDYEAKALAFAEYLAEGSSSPELLPPDGDGRTPGASFLQTVYLFLVEVLRLRPSEALDYPLGRAKHDFFAWHEAKGKARILNEEEREELVSAHSDEMLQACLAALPGSVPLPPVKGGDDAV